MGTGIRCNDGVTSRAGDHGQPIALQRGQGEDLDIVHGIIHGIDPHTSCLLKGVVNQLVIGEKGGGMGVGNMGTRLESI